tara:strand:- start:33019 stop:33210 length:192 start_codon:yes stop_codon:yes gene_type:complete
MKEVSKEDESVVLLAMIGREYLLRCQESREFRRKMEKTAFGIKIKAYLTHLKKSNEVDSESKD